MKRASGVAGLLLALCAATAQGGIIAEGFSVTLLAPPQAAGSTTANRVAISPSGDTWWSAGSTIYKLGTGETWASAEALRVNGGGPIGNTSISTALVFDAAGRQYINDAFSGDIYRRETEAAAWAAWGELPRVIQDMRFAANGDLYALADLGLWKVATDGTATRLADTSFSQDFAFDADGNLVITRYDGSGIDLYNVTTGALTTPISYPERIGFFESIAISDGGQYIVGVNTGTAIENGVERNTSELVRINPATGAVEIIGYDVGDSIPTDLKFLDNGSLLIAGYGSLHPLEVAGDFDSAFTALPPRVFGTPEPGSIVLLALGAVAALPIRRRWLQP